MNRVYPVRDVGRLVEVKALVFDLDGTLIDSAPAIGGSLKVAFEAVGREMSSVDLRDVIGPPIAVIARIVEPLLTDEELAEILREFRSDYDAKGWQATIAFAGVVESLRRLRGMGLRLFVLTNKPRFATEMILKRLGIAAEFESVLTRDSRTPAYLSKTEMLAHLIGKHGLKPAESIMIGDTLEDGEAAKGNGVRFVHAAYGYGVVPETELAVETFATLVGIVSGAGTGV